MKTAMIWGAAGGIGRALTHALIADGWQVAAFSRNADEIEDVATYSYSADISSINAINEAIYTANFDIDNVDLFIYAAGDIAQEKVADTKSATWDRVLNANLTGAVMTTQASLPLMGDGATLIYLGAVSERLRLPSLSAYVAAKSALEAWVATAAKEDRKRSYLLVRPGAVDTPFWERVTLRKPKDAASAEKVATKIIEAVANGTKGTLDITH